MEIEEYTIGLKAHQMILFVGSNQLANFILHCAPNFQPQTAKIKFQMFWNSGTLRRSRIMIEHT